MSGAFKGRTSRGGTTRGVLLSSTIDCQFDLWPRPRRGLLKQEGTTPSHGFCKGDLIAFRGAGTTGERGGQKTGVCSFRQCVRRHTGQMEAPTARHSFFSGEVPHQRNCDLKARSMGGWSRRLIYMAILFAIVLAFLWNVTPPNKTPTAPQNKTTNKASLNDRYDYKPGLNCSLKSQLHTKKQHAVSAKKTISLRAQPPTPTPRRRRRRWYPFGAHRSKSELSALWDFFFFSLFFLYLFKEGRWIDNRHMPFWGANYTALCEIGKPVLSEL